MVLDSIETQDELDIAIDLYKAHWDPNIVDGNLPDLSSHASSSTAEEPPADDSNVYDLVALFKKLLNYIFGNHTEAESNIIYTDEPLDILNNFKAHMALGLETDSESVIIQRALDYIRNLLPENYWSSSSEELKDSTSLINKYLDNFSHVIINTEITDETYVHLMQFNAAITTQNIIQLTAENPLKSEEDLFIEVLETMYEQFKQVNQDVTQQQ